MKEKDIFVRDSDGDKIYCPLIKEPCFKSCAWYNKNQKECAVLDLSKSFRSFEVDFERKEF